MIHPELRPPSRRNVNPSIYHNCEAKSVIGWGFWEFRTRPVGSLSPSLHGEVKHLLQSCDLPLAPLSVVLVLKNISRHFLGTQRADRVFFCAEDDGSHSVLPRFFGRV